MTRRRLVPILRWAPCLVLAQLVSAAPSWADEAADLDQRARAAFAKDDFAGAASAFEEAYRAKPHPATKYNAALAWEKANEMARAADAFESAIESEGLDAARANAARTRLSVLKPMLGYVFAAKPLGATVSVAHVAKAPVPARFHLSPGAHLMAFELRDGSRVERSVVLKAGVATTVEVDGSGEAAPPGPPPPPTATPTPATPPRTPSTSPPARETATTCSSCTWGWVALGAGVAAAGAGAYFGAQTLSAKSDFDDSGKTDADAHDRAVTHRTLTNVAFGVAAVAGGVGLYLLLTGSESKPESADLSLGVNPNGFDARWRF